MISRLSLMLDKEKGISLQNKLEEEKKVTMESVSSMFWTRAILIPMIASFILGVFGTSSARADTTYVSGIIDTNTVWDTTGSPYVVTGNILIDTGVTLDIRPGVEVRINENLYMMINGTLNATGTETDSVIITRNEAVKWDRLWFRPASAGSLLYCRIEYAGNSAVFADSLVGSLYIGFNTIRNSSGYWGGGISCRHGSSSTITSNTITNNSGYYHAGGIACYWSSPLITGNTITNNYCSGGLVSGGGGISCERSSPTITGNIITNNSTDVGGGGIFCDFDSSPTVNDNVIANNSALGGGGILSYSYSSPTIAHNTIMNNSAERGGSIYSWAGETTNLTSNTIIDTAATAIYIRAIEANHTIANNNLYSTGYTVYLRDCPDNINATNNYWYTINTDTIDGKIWDYYDDFVEGIVHYTPFLTSGDTNAPVPPPLNLSATQTGPIEITLDWAAVPVADLVGYKIYYDTDDSGYPYEGTGANEGDSPINVGNTTSFSITGLTQGQTYYVAVTAYDNSGDSSWYSNEGQVYLTGIKESDQLKITDLGLKVSPNPFYRHIAIQGVRKEVKIYDLSGRLIGKTANSIWDGKDIYGREVRAGVYFLKTEDYKPMKVIRLR